MTKENARPSGAEETEGGAGSRPLTRIDSPGKWPYVVYCGAYHLLRRRADGQLFRSNKEAVDGYERVSDATDSDGYLKPQYWALPRLVMQRDDEQAAGVDPSSLRAQIEELADVWELEGAHRGGSDTGKLLLASAAELRALLSRCSNAKS